MMPASHSRRALLIATVIFATVFYHIPYLRHLSIHLTPDNNPQPIRYFLSEIRQLSFPTSGGGGGGYHPFSPRELFNSASATISENGSWDVPKPLRYLGPLTKTKSSPNPYTGHLRISETVLNISFTPKNTPAELQKLFNPTIIALPHWSINQYLIISRVVTEGLHQESLLCEARMCYAGGPDRQRSDEEECTESDLAVLGPSGGLRCINHPVAVNIPPTPSERCEGKWAPLSDIPGFHDPRLFWSGKGEPLLMVNSQYAP